MAKRLFALILALLLCGAALSESAYDAAVSAGYAPTTKAVSSKARVCHFEEKGGKCAVIWTDGGVQYRVVEARSPERGRELYLRLIALKPWEACVYISRGRRLYGYNASGQVVNACPTLASYIDAVTAQVRGATPRPTPRPTPTPAPRRESTGVTYVLNTKTGKFHRLDCRFVRQMHSENRADVNWSRERILGEGYVPCQVCNP